MTSHGSSVWVSALATGLLTVSVAAAGPGRTAGQATDVPAGSTLFSTYCASCHGQSGRGNGSVAIFLKVPPADLTQIATRNKGTFPAERVYQIIDGRQAVRPHGDSQMPVWGEAFGKSMTGGSEEATAARIRALVKYLESIQKPAGA
jgi:mono/diheme cytochrome c family protein